MSTDDKGMDLLILRLLAVECNTYRLYHVVFIHGGFAAEPAPSIVNGSITLDFVQVGAIMAYSEQWRDVCSGTPSMKWQGGNGTLW